MGFNPLFSAVSDPAGPAGIPLRSEIPRELTWDLEAIFSSGDEWEEAFRSLEGEIEELLFSAGADFLILRLAACLLSLEDRTSENLARSALYV